MNNKFDPSRSIEELAAEVAQLPDGTGFGSGDVGALFHGLCLGKNGVARDPSRYASIYAAVAATTTVSPWMKAAAKIEEINGRRRVSGADLTHLTEKLGEVVAQASGELPNSPERNLLLGDAEYNRGIMLRGLRRYDDADKAQQYAAGWFFLAGNREKALTSLFVSEVEAISQLFVEKNEPGDAILALIDFDEFMVRTLLGDYPTWMLDNAPLHIAWAVMMDALVSGEFESALLEDADVQSRFASARASQFPHWATLFQAWEEFLAKDYEKVIARTPVELPSSSADDTALSMQILVALAEEKLGQYESPKRRLEAVRDHQGSGGGIPMAVAEVVLNCRYA